MISNITGGFGAATGGSLGTLYVRLAADSTSLVKEMAGAEKTVSGSALVIAKALAGIGAAFAGLALLAVREANRFESSFAGVRKTVSATEAEFTKLAKSFRNMAKEIPINVNEINRIAEAAGSLGIENENLEKFTRTMALMGVTTNLSSDQAATQMARFANITRMSQKDFDRLGSTIVALGNKFATTESEISTMSLRIAAAGSEVGLAEHQILAFATTLSSVGVEAEAGGTAISQAMIKMAKAVTVGGEQLDLFAAAAGVTARDFKELFEKDASGAIIKFLQGLRSIKDQGGDVFTFMEKMNLDGARMSDVITRAGRAHAMFSKSLKEGEEAWVKNVALVKEADERFKTFDSQLLITWNLIKELAMQVGEGLVPGLREMNNSAQETLKSWAEFSDEIKWVTEKIIPAFMFGVDLINIGLKTWSMWINTIILAFATLAKAVANIMGGIVRAVTDSIEDASDALTNGINSLIRKVNQYLPEVAHISEMDFRVNINLVEKFDEASKGWDEVANRAKENLKALAIQAAISSMDMKKNWEKLTESLEVNIEKRGINTVERFQAAAWKAVEASKELGLASGSFGTGFTSMSANIDGTTNKLGMLKIQMDKTNALFEQMGIGKIGSKTQRQMGALGATGGNGDMMNALGLANEFEGTGKKMDELESMKEYMIMVEGLRAEHQARLLAAQEDLAAKEKALWIARHQMAVGAAENMFGSLAQIGEQWGGKQSGFYKAMFAASKAFAIADATIKIFQGVANAAAFPYPANILAMAQVAAATASLVSNISAVQLAFDGEKAMGGPVTAGKRYLVGERGPEAFVPRSSGTIIPNDRMMGGGGNMTVNVIVEPGLSVQRQERQEGDAKVLDVFIRRAEERMASNIINGTGTLPKAIERTYRGVKRGS